MPHFDCAAFSREALPAGGAGVFACLPFAIWFYLAIEGVANAAEEARDPQRDVARGFGSALVTLVVLALLVFFSATGVAGWRAIVYAPGSQETSDAPLPLALAQVVGKESGWYALLVGVGLLGLVASFHGILLAAARATLEFGRSGYAPRWLGRVHARTGTPRVALFVNLAIGSAAILTGRTADIIVLSVFGALLLYVLSMLALLRLRRTEPNLERPFKALAYPWFPLSALTIAGVCLVAMTWYNRRMALEFAALLAIGLVYYVLYVRGKVDTAWARGA